MNFIVKAHLQRADTTVEVRRIPVSVTSQDRSGIFNEVAVKVGNAFPGLAGKLFTLKWKDADGDYVVMSTDEEMLEAVSHAQNAPLKVFITIDGVKESETEEVLEMQSDKNQEPEDAESCTNEPLTGDHCKAGWPFMSMGMPLGQSPPCMIRCAGRSSSGKTRKREHPDCFNPLGHPGHHFGPHGHPGHHFGPHGNPGHHFGHPGQHFGPHGHHAHNFGPFGSHNRHNMDMFGPFEYPFFEGAFPGTSMHMGHHFGRHHHGKRHHGEDGWKANLREAVPVAHRRWAKAFIRSWRIQNLKNATSTSNDSDQDVFDLDASSVPEAYAKWLETVLPKWHKRLGQETADVSKDKEKSEEDKNKLKASVPKEFRKWAKWYLARHFGKKEAPKFRKHGGCKNFDKMIEKRGKDWKKACKMLTLNASIPMTHRMWAKIFIRDWRQEHNIPDPKDGSRGIVSSESEDTERETNKGDITVPNDYVRWMRKFLSRWHLWRGEVEKVEIERGGMGEFKDTVPKSFRKWVKCFLWQRYSNGVRKEADTASQYQRWLQAFQQKWLIKQNKGDSADELVLTSSDDETANRPSDVEEAEKTVESSLKKLRLEGDEDGTKKNVRFNPSTESVNNEEVARKNNSDIGDFEGTLFHKKMNGGFRNWVKEALWQWDGRTAQAGGANVSEQIPPHVYNWMSKMMVKIQMKRMKQELKQAKRSMKTAMKAQK